MIWTVGLLASHDDVRRLATELPAVVAAVPDKPDALRVDLVDPEGQATGDEARAAARQAIEALVDRLNGLGRLRWGRSFRGVRVKSVLSTSETVPPTQHIFVSTVYAHLLPEERALAMRNLGQPVPPIPDGWDEIKALDLGAVASLAEADDEVRQVLHLVHRVLEDDAQLDWVLAYLTLELVEGDLDARGVDGGHVGVWSEAQRSLFKHTANSFGALGVRARHGRERTHPPSSPMSDEDAAWFVRRTITRWLTHRMGTRVAVAPERSVDRPRRP